ncbi:eCIS core domain-containing protein [Dictyobacter formicarum]|uniref:eCIS core domain-containing protein n=1 Tax=Dictyobacter formicarum TaxID=2778368 RepID=A0ABQ3VPL8_9CHLR|nr:DUF4157 domain-containing protein [Dictyobacter formicarum]GHO87634.1 hypothetical protein KSZ_56400 [Dictyobacter formicarum]
MQRRENSTGLPDDLKTRVEHLSGISMDDVQVHYDSPKPAQVQALAYTQGTDIHVGPGQEQHLAHEAWHVVQQKQGRVPPTVQTGDVAINNDQGLEREADAMGAEAGSMRTQTRQADYVPLRGTAHEQSGLPASLRVYREQQLEINPPQQSSLKHLVSPVIQGMFHPTNVYSGQTFKLNPSQQIQLKNAVEQSINSAALALFTKNRKLGSVAALITKYENEDVQNFEQIKTRILTDLGVPTQPPEALKISKEEEINEEKKNLEQQGILEQDQELNKANKLAEIFRAEEMPKEEGSREVAGSLATKHLTFLEKINRVSKVGNIFTGEFTGKKSVEGKILSEGEKRVELKKNVLEFYAVVAQLKQEKEEESPKKLFFYRKVLVSAQKKKEIEQAKPGEEILEEILPFSVNINADFVKNWNPSPREIVVKIAVSTSYGMIVLSSPDKESVLSKDPGEAALVPSRFILLELIEEDNKPVYLVRAEPLHPGQVVKTLQEPGDPLAFVTDEIIKALEDINAGLENNAYILVKEATKSLTDALSNLKKRIQSIEAGEGIQKLIQQGESVLASLNSREVLYYLTLSK